MVGFNDLNEGRDTMKRSILLAIITLLLTACVPNMPNYIQQQESIFDNSIQLKMEPGFVYHGEGTFSGGDLKLGLFWNSRLKDSLWIIAEVPQKIVNIDSNEGLLFNVNDDIVTLSSKEILTDYDSKYVSGWNVKKSSNCFPSDLNFIKRILDAESVKVKLVTGDGYVEGDFKADKPSAAIRGFRDFMKKVEEVSR